MLERLGQSSFPLGLLLLRFKETFQVSLNTEASCACDIGRETGWLSSSGQGCFVDACELPSHIIWFTLPPSHIRSCLLSPHYPWVVILVFMSNLGKSGNLLYPHCPLAFFIQEEFPTYLFPHV